MSNPVLEINELRTQFTTDGGLVTAVDGASLRVEPGEAVGLVGESGCGKSALAQSVLRLHEPRTVTYGGRIDYRGTDILSLSDRELRSIRGSEIGMIFQDPISSLNPVKTIGWQICEVLRLHQRLNRKDSEARAIHMLTSVGIDDAERVFGSYPHQLSGGMRQRAMIAMALSCEPKLLIADEPTTALDVTVQAQILQLMVKLQESLGVGILFITHDLGVVAQFCSRLIVMYLGQVVEAGPTMEVLADPRHPYTRGLLESRPELAKSADEPLPTISGTVPSLNDVPHGCRYWTRCMYAEAKCRTDMPVLESVAPLREVRCWRQEEIRQMNGSLDDR